MRQKPRRKQKPRLRFFSNQEGDKDQEGDQYKEWDTNLEGGKYWNVTKTEMSPKLKCYSN